MISTSQYRPNPVLNPFTNHIKEKLGCSQNFEMQEVDLYTLLIHKNKNFL